MENIPTTFQTRVLERFMSPEEIESLSRKYKEHKQPLRVPARTPSTLEREIVSRFKVLKGATSRVAREFGISTQKVESSVRRVLRYDALHS